MRNKTYSGTALNGAERTKFSLREFWSISPSRITPQELLEQKVLELDVINRFVQNVNSSLILNETLDRALEGIHIAIQPDLCFIFTRDRDKLILKNVLPKADISLFSTVPEHKVGECMCGLTVEAKKPLYSVNILKDDRCTWDECRQAGVRSFAALPLMEDGDVFGVIGIASKTERDFQKQDKFLQIMAIQTSIALINSKLFESARMELRERKRAERELLKLKENLQKQVSDKTKVLEEKVFDLQRFQDAAVNRELRMKELYDENEKLKKELESKQEFH